MVKMAIRKWKEGFQFYNGIDADKVGNEIDSIGESVTPQQIVDLARNKNTELHKCFEWDDSIAGEKYRLSQARMIVCHLVYVEETMPTDRPEIRCYFKPKESGGYKETKTIIKIESEYESLLKQAWNELQMFKRKYSMLEELREILDLIQ